MNAKTFNEFRNLIYEKSGISLSDGKEPLIYSRVGKRMRSLGVDNYQAYLKHIVEDESGQEVVCLLDAISTNVTSFFRGNDHFRFLSKMVKEWEASGQRRMRFWSAACSTGEEPYSMCITILEALGENYNARILATDISTRALAAAQHGAYEKDKIKQVPGILAERYFSMSSESDEVCYMAKPVLKNMVVFKRLNLSVPPFPMRGPLDIVFCRNVMIYFDNRVRHGLLSEIYRILKPQGYLMVGHSESLVGIIKGFKAVQPSIYMKKG